MMPRVLLRRANRPGVTLSRRQKHRRHQKPRQLSKQALRRHKWQPDAAFPALIISPLRKQNRPLAACRIVCWSTIRG